jgi:hypothetical protein
MEVNVRLSASTALFLGKYPLYLCDMRLVGLVDNMDVVGKTKLPVDVAHRTPAFQLAASHFIDIGIYNLDTNTKHAGFRYCTSDTMIIKIKMIISKRG